MLVERGREVTHPFLYDATNRAYIDRINKRFPMTKELLARISIDPKICGGRPCIKGTRMRVSDLIDMLASGATRDEILRDFPYISGDDISAALAYAARAVDHRIVPAA